MRQILLASATGLLAALLACTGQADPGPADDTNAPNPITAPVPPPATPPNSPAPTPPGSTTAATIEFLNIEGGCWAIKVGNNTYQPLNLPQEFQQHGLRVNVVFEPVEGYASICMIGPIVRIVSISRR